MKAHYLLRQLAWMTSDELRTARYVARHANRCLAQAAVPVSPLSACTVFALAGGVVLHQRAQARLAHGLAQETTDLAARCDAHAATQAALLQAQVHLDAQLRGEVPQVPPTSGRLLDLPTDAPNLPCPEVQDHANIDATPGAAAKLNSPARNTAEVPPTSCRRPARPTNDTEVPDADTTLACTDPTNAHTAAPPSARSTPTEPASNRDEELRTHQAQLVAHFKHLRNILAQSKPAPPRPADTPNTARSTPPRGSLSGLPLPSDRAREVEVIH